MSLTMTTGDTLTDEERRDLEKAFGRCDCEWCTRRRELIAKLLRIVDGFPRSTVVPWRGSVGDLVTDLSPLLGAAGMKALMRELAWREDSVGTTTTEVVPNQNVPLKP